jgi:hypothetical protein
LCKVGSSNFSVMCNKSFTCSSYLKEHQPVHNEGLFYCAVCNISFVFNSNLNSYQHIHSVERPFFCVVCIKSFIYKTDMKKTSVGTYIVGSLRFSCNICGKLFIYKYELRKLRHVWDCSHVSLMCAVSLSLNRFIWILRQYMWNYSDITVSLFNSVWQNYWIPKYGETRLIGNYQKWMKTRFCDFWGTALACTVGSGHFSTK